MIRNYLTFSELYYHYPRIEQWVDNSHVTSILNAAGMVVANDLRNRGVDTQRIYIPLMFDSATYGAHVSRTDHTATGLSIHNERRFVIDVSSTTSLNVALQGSNDNTNWEDVVMLDGQLATIDIYQAGTYNRAFIEGYKYVRYSTTGTASLYAYVVDTSFDQLIIFKALQQITLPLVGNDGLAEAMYNQSVAMYQSLLGSAVFDYDRGGDGAIDDHDRDVTPRRRVMR